MPEIRIDGPLHKIVFLAIYATAQSRRIKYHVWRGNMAGKSHNRHMEKMHEVHQELLHRINAG
jgi:hypothetical protein